MLLLVEKDIRGGKYHAIHPCVKANNKYMKDYDENKESLYLKYLDVNNFMTSVMSQKLPVCGFKWVENTSQFTKDFIENYKEDIDEGNFLEVDVQHPEKLHDLHNDLSFLSESIKIQKFGKLAANLNDKKEYVIHNRN